MEADDRPDNPKLVITTGTAGGVGANVALGDVIVARTVEWDATLRFADQPWAHTAYHSSATVAGDAFAAATATLIPVNAAHLPTAAREPQVFLDSDATPAHTITTDSSPSTTPLIITACAPLTGTLGRWRWTTPRSL